MSYSKSEVGHALNAANLERLILTCQLLGANYNPVSRQLQIGNLMQLLTDSRNAIDQVTNYLNAHKNAVNNRQENFATLKSLGTRIIGALISGGASLATIKDAKAINAKLQGKGKNVPRPPKAKVEDANSNEETNNSNVETPNSNAETNNSNAEDTKSDGKKKRVISSVQQSYAQIVAHFAQLVNFLQQTPGYNPNETDLQVSNLLRVANTLQAENSAVTLAEIGLKNARILRDDILYNPQTGVVATALLVKEYCKSVLSTKSPLYKEVNKIRFSGKK